MTSDQTLFLRVYACVYVYNNLPFSFSLSLHFPVPVSPGGSKTLAVVSIADTALPVILCLTTVSVTGPDNVLLAPTIQCIVSSDLFVKCTHTLLDRYILQRGQCGSDPALEQLI